MIKANKSFKNNKPAQKIFKFCNKNMKNPNKH